MIRTILLLVAGIVLYTLSFPPADLGFIGFVALVPFVVAAHGAAGWKNFLLFYLAGIVLFCTGCFWLRETCFLSLLGMSLFQGLALPVFAFLYRRGTLRCGLPVWVCVPVAWIAVEFIRSVFPENGFPWLLVGYSAWRIPPLLQTADLFGVWGPGLLMAAGSGVAASALLDRMGGRNRRGGALSWCSKATFRGGAVFFLLLAAALVYGFWRPSTVGLEKGPVVAAVQGNIPQELKRSTQSWEERFRIYCLLTEGLFGGDAVSRPDLVLWPETIIPLMGTEEELEEYTLKVAPGAWFLMGTELLLTHSGREDPLKLNSALLFDREGRYRSHYSKTILVPGGEYLPWIDLMPCRESIEDFVHGVAGFLPDLDRGEGPKILVMEKDGREYAFGVQICFENIYGRYCRRFVADGAQFMVNLSNEGWFKESSEFDQMMAMSLFRAVETRRSLFRSTNTGISSLIDPLGALPGRDRMVSENGRDRAVKGVLLCEVPLCTVQTFYTEWGDILPLVIFVVQAAILLISFGKGWVVTRTIGDDTTSIIEKTTE